TRVGPIVFFTAESLFDGRELWKTDGTSTGTVLVKDIGPGSGFSSNPSFLTPVGSTLYFSAFDAATELWKSDGTTPGTVMVKRINTADPALHGSRPSALTSFNGNLYFMASDGIHGTELWKSDGTEAGTMLVKDLQPGAGGTSVGRLW